MPREPMTAQVPTRCGRSGAGSDVIHRRHPWGSASTRMSCRPDAARRVAASPIVVRAASSGVVIPTCLMGNLASETIDRGARSADRCHRCAARPSPGPERSSWPDSSAFPWASRANRAAAADRCNRCRDRRRVRARCPAAARRARAAPSTSVSIGPPAATTCAPAARAGPALASERRVGLPVECGIRRPSSAAGGVGDLGERGAEVLLEADRGGVALATDVGAGAV